MAVLTPEVVSLALLCFTTLAVAELIRRYYIVKQEYEYKTRRLAHDDNILAADGGEEEVEE